MARLRTALALLATVLLLPLPAAAQTRVYSFPYSQPPDELAYDVMDGISGQTEVRLTFGGDCTLGGETGGSAKRFARVVKANGYAYPFEGLQPLLMADDLTLVNLEGVLSDRKLPKEDKRFNFKGSAAYTAILTEGGVECVSLANNHTMDFGARGYEDTVAALQSAGIGCVDADYVTVLEKDGVRVGFTASGFTLDREAFLRQAQALRALGCAALVHMMHKGEEYAGHVTAGQESTARFLAENGVALVVGSHPHVVQGLAVLGRTLVAYSLGNCVFGGNTDPDDYDACLLGVTLRFTDGVADSAQASIWPIRVSGTARANDYRPALLAGADAARVLTKMQASSGFALAPFQEGAGAVQATVDLR